VPVILGQNIVTTITPIISSISGNTDSKRVAASCVIIKTVGVVVIGGGFFVLDAFLDFGFMSWNANPMTIAVVHTAFNILSTVILIPFCSLFAKLAEKLIKGKKGEGEKDVFATLDERFLDMPGFAVEKCRELVCDMASISRDAFSKATSLMDNYDPAVFEEVNALESLVDKYEDKTSTYLVRIAETQISAKDSKIVIELLHCIGDIERISDHALNIAEAAKEIHDKKIAFSEKARGDIGVITSAVSETLDYAIDSLVTENLDTAKHVEPLEQVIDHLKRKIKNGHISRLRQGDCTMELGFVLSDLLTNYERISDHCSNIAVAIIETKLSAFDTHKYLNDLKYGDEAFKQKLDAYEEKYSL